MRKKGLQDSIFKTMEKHGYVAPGAFATSSEIATLMDMETHLIATALSNAQRSGHTERYKVKRDNQKSAYAYRLKKTGKNSDSLNAAPEKTEGTAEPAVSEYIASPDVNVEDLKAEIAQLERRLEIKALQLRKEALLAELRQYD